MVVVSQWENTMVLQIWKIGKECLRNLAASTFRIYFNYTKYWVLASDRNH